MTLSCIYLRRRSPTCQKHPRTTHPPRGELRRRWSPQSPPTCWFSLELILGGFGGKLGEGAQKYTKEKTSRRRRLQKRRRRRLPGLASVSVGYTLGFTYYGCVWGLVLANDDWVLELLGLVGDTRSQEGRDFRSCHSSFCLSGGG